MTSKPIYRKLFIPIIIMTFLHSNSLGQDASVTQANQYFNQGLSYFNEKNYKQSIDNFSISIAEFPETITYYALTNAYARNGDWGNAGMYANYIGNLNPPLSSAFYSSLQQIKTWV